MNVAIISPEFPPNTNWGGVATFNYYLSQLLCNLNHNVHVLTYDGMGNKYWTKINKKIIVHYVPLKFKSHFLNFLYFKFPFGLIRYFLKYFPSLNFIIDWNVFVWFKFRDLKKTVHFDILHAPSYESPAILIYLLNQQIPKILHLQGPQFIFNKYENTNLEKYIITAFENFFLLFSSSIIVSCSFDLLTRTLNKFPSLKVRLTYIPNFIASSEYSNFLNISVNNIVFVGRFEVRKGVDQLLKAFITLSRRNNSINLYLIGKDTKFMIYANRLIYLSEYLNRLNISSQIKKRIHILHEINDRKKLIKKLKKIKGIAVIPSLYEPFGFVTIEFMALGYITLASVNGGGKEIIDHTVDGFNIYPRKSNIIKYLLKSFSLTRIDYTKLSLKAQGKIKAKFSTDAVALKYKLLYSKLIKTQSENY